MEESGGLKVYKDTDELAHAAALFFVGLSREKIRERGAFSVVLAGGRTPEKLYRLMASPGFKEKVDWTKVHFFWGDERCVPPDAPESNYGMAVDTLLKRVPAPPGNIHRIQGELDPSVAAALYEEEIKEYFKDSPRAFDLVLLGLGEDGHTLSLFPATRALEEKKRLVSENYVERLGSWRVTMTLGLVNEASNVAFIVSGEAKGEALKAALGEGGNPAGLVRPANGRLLWFVDRGAARLL